MLAVGVMIWLGSQLMFFSGLFAAFFTIRAQAVGGVWPPKGTELDTVRGIIFTLVLVSSSFTMQYAVNQVEWRRRKSARRWIVAYTFVLVGIAGLNGSGRSELLRTIFGLDPVRRGKIRVGAFSGAATAQDAKQGPEVPYVPTSQVAVEAMLKLAGVTGEDVVYDLGCGVTFLREIRRRSDKNSVSE